ncbi:Hsp33 family molecular chaperone HslO [Clostridium aminobutyricum]|uniref:33 kDa chaperonin n=1 Tax=Clostridium aminobutyricum TaxID=33953 RepID=A0A939IHR2_CLOAM|nr:Hsp33 family molecular chaperone HslO [Clostridium aminobutyricum]MBN7774117.1 Hsp33 family molecular chaperone HslO [Clostridium aminobutyricum]
MGKALIALDKSKSYRVYLTISTDMVEAARQIHQTSPLATAGLGRVLTGAGLMGIMLKNDSDKLTLNFTGDGPAKQILATANGKGMVKGYISNPDVDLPLTEEGKLDVGASLGIGDITVIKDLGLKEPYVGTISLVSGEIADDLTAYFFISEQQNSSVALGVKIARNCSVLCAGGLIIQMLPDYGEACVDALEEMIGKMKPLTMLIEETILQSAGKTEEGILEDLLQRIFKEMPEEYTPQTLEFREVKWQCDCSEERLEQVLMTIGKKELGQIIEEDGKAELVCQFCETKYFFNREHLQKIFERI